MAGRSDSQGGGGRPVRGWPAIVAGLVDMEVHDRFVARRVSLCPASRRAIEDPHGMDDRRLRACLAGLRDGAGAPLGNRHGACRDVPIATLASLAACEV